MKILLLGADGQVGWALQRSLLPLGDVMPSTRADMDLTNLALVRDAVCRHAPDIIVNAAAYTAVDKAESEVALANRINADVVEVLAEETQRLGGWLIHYSTDYVFNGRNPRPYVETDAPDPLSAYGASKLRGEEAIRKVGCRHMIFRTSWVYAVRGSNFPKTILRLARTRDELRVVSDQIGAPTSADLIADVTALALAQAIRAPEGAPSGLGGTYHLAAAGQTSWHAFACHILRLAVGRGLSLKVGPDRVVPIATVDYPSPAKRIANSRLATDKLRSTFGLSLPPWETHAERFMAELSPESV
ncbi:MAG: dTDP-4-dehydrorhamnose reductase [Rhodospirillaceae bacterium]|nr:MAG: dTDP-4-dehydrorhamnose reductase [Rhodospirillaceae bacterium]